MDTLNISNSKIIHICMFYNQSGLTYSLGLLYHFLLSIKIIMFMCVRYLILPQIRILITVLINLTRVIEAKNCLIYIFDFCLSVTSDLFYYTCIVDDLCFVWENCNISYTMILIALHKCSFTDDLQYQFILMYYRVCVNSYGQFLEDSLSFNL